MVLYPAFAQDEVNCDGFLNQAAAQKALRDDPSDPDSLGGPPGTRVFRNTGRGLRRPFAPADFNPVQTSEAHPGDSTIPSPPPNTNPPPSPKVAPPLSPPLPSTPLLKADSPENSPVLTMKCGNCPKEFPEQREGACYR